MPPQRTIAIAMELNLPFQWHYGIYTGVQQYAHRHKHWHCVIDEFPQYHMNRARGAQPYDGIIARVTRSLASSATRHDIPVVNVWSTSPVRSVPTVNIDFAECGRLCVEHLLERGFRRFGFIMREHHPNDLVENSAFQQRVEEAGFSSSSVMVDNGDLVDAKTWGRTQDKILEWLQSFERPVGIFVPQGNFSRHIVHLCDNLGWHVPLDVAIICGENDPIFCESPAPSLTAIERNFANVGYEAARLLDRILDGEEPPTEPTSLPPRGIVPRNSTDFFAVEDALVGDALRFMNANLRKPLDVQLIASAIATSPRTLQRRFKQCMDRSVAAEVRRLRVELAKRMLVDLDNPITQVARDSGFDSAIRMHEVFKRELGVSPSEFRKQQLQSS